MMSGVAGFPGQRSGGTRQQRAAELRAQTEAAQAAQAPPPPQTAGADWRPVQPGETLEGIAAEYGLAAEEIWNHPLNKQLRDRRGSDPSALRAGDALYVPAQRQAQDAQPVGQGDYVVKPGDCISSIAKDTGHFWETIWNDAANAELHEVRREPNLLLPGDRVTIPPLRPKQESGATELRHRFVRRGEPSALRMTLRSGGQPRANEPWTLDVDGRQFSGVTDPEGKLDVPIPGNARRAKLTVGHAGENQDVFNLALGQLDPIAALTGVQARLKNLGYALGAVDGVLGPKTRAALKRFQAEQNLPATGRPDDQTRERLQSVHGS